jgi:hypothetical protein
MHITLVAKLSWISSQVLSTSLTIFSCVKQFKTLRQIVKNRTRAVSTRMGPISLSVCHLANVIKLFTVLGLFTERAFHRKGYSPNAL